MTPPSVVRRSFARVVELLYFERGELEDHAPDGVEDGVEEAVDAVSDGVEDVVDGVGDESDDEP